MPNNNTATNFREQAPPRQERYLARPKNLHDWFNQNKESYKYHTIAKAFETAGIPNHKLNQIEITDQLPHWVGGGYIPSLQKIIVNEYFLTFSPNAISHILIHEAIHAGWPKQLKGIEVMDEALTELMTRKIIGEHFGEIEFTSGYVGIVRDLEELLGNENIPISELSELVLNEENATLDNILERIILKPLIQKFKLTGDMELLSDRKILSEMQLKWDLINKLFPRLLHAVNGNGSALHEEANYPLPNFRTLRLLKKARETILSDQEIMNIIFKYAQDNYIEIPIITKEIQLFNLITKAFNNAGMNYVINTYENISRLIWEKFLTYTRYYSTDTNSSQLQEQ